MKTKERLDVSNFGIELPSDEHYERYNDGLLEEFYKGINKDDTINKIKRCCKYLNIKEPTFKKSSNLEIFLELIEGRCLYDMIIEDHRDI